jgi:replication factor C subunit 2/4
MASTANGSDLPYELPWYVVTRCRWPRGLIQERVEKYRPHVLDDVVGNSDTISRLKVIATDGNVPHLIISVTDTLRYTVFVA